MFYLAKFCQCYVAYFFLRHLNCMVIFGLPFNYFLTQKNCFIFAILLETQKAGLVIKQCTDHAIHHDNISFHSSGTGKKRGKEPFWNTWSNVNNVIIFLTNKKEKTRQQHPHCVLDRKEDALLFNSRHGNATVFHRVSCDSRVRYNYYFTGIKQLRPDNKRFKVLFK